jgi:hypothetical protein
MLRGMLLAGLIALGSPGGLGGQALAGEWRVELVLEAGAGPDPATARSVRGTVSLAPPPAAPAGLPDPGPAVHAGTFAIDFRPFGFAPESTEALAWLARGDTVRMLLNAVVDHGVLELVGVRAAGGEVTGSWARVGDRRDPPHGRFRMWRQPEPAQRLRPRAEPGPPH